MREIGTLKAIGMRVADIQKIYQNKYIAMALVGALAGFALALLVKDGMLAEARLYLELGQAPARSLIFGFLASLLVALAVILFVQLILRRFYRLSPVQALNQARSQAASSRGLSFQALFSNPLATADTLGVASASSVGAVIAILLSMNLLGTQVLALAFGLVSIWLTLQIGKTRDKSKISLILAGIIMSSFFNAITSLLKYTADPQDKLPEITYWLMGSFSSASYKNILLGAPLIIIGGLMIYLMRWRLNVLALSDEEAESMGIDVRKSRLFIILAATMITASSVSMCGQIGWIGLIVPHLSRLVVGSNNRYLVPLSASLGRPLLVLIDCLARTVSIIELPLSVLTALIGAPIFIILMKRKGGVF